MNMHDILLDVSRAKRKADKIRRLRDHDSPPLRMLIKSSYDPKIEWFLPEGEVPYKPNKNESGHVKLSSKMSQVEKLVWNNKTNVGKENALPQFQREKIFIDLLEMLSPEEAKVLISAKDKSLHQMFVISHNVVKDTFEWTDEYHVKS